MPTSNLIHVNASRFLAKMLGKNHAQFEETGDVIGHFRLCNRLGEGGFGNVWSAEQTEPVRRMVALKVIKLGMDTEQVLNRFEHERQALANLDHPSIATLLDAGKTADGRPYFAMELVEGEAITQWCSTHQSPLHERLRLFIQVCQAVQHAHQKGIIHRDLKPSNILVTRIDGQPLPKVIDFGIAKIIHADAFDVSTLLTQAHQVLGTPLYMSPEQITCGTSIDTRSDIYSLGVLLYMLLTGVLPFERDSSGEERRRLIHEITPHRPSTQRRRLMQMDKCEASIFLPLHDSFTSYSSDLDWITMRALEKDRERRYQTAAEFAGDVQRFLNQEPVLACPPSFGYVSACWIRRHRTAFTSACLILCTLIVCSALAFWQAHVARSAQYNAEVAAAKARQAEQITQEALKKSRQSSTFVTELLDRIIREVNNGRNPEALKAALADCDLEVLKLISDPELRIALLEKIEGIYSKIGELKLAIPMAQAKARELGRLHGAASEITLDAELSHLKLVMDFGARATSPDLLEDLQQRVVAAGGRGGKFWLEVQRTLCRAWIKLDQPKKALEASQKLITEAEAQKLSNRSMVVHQIAHAAALKSAGRYDQALALLEKARPHAKESVHSTRIDEQVVFLLESKRDYKKGTELLRRKLAEQQAIHGSRSQALLPVLMQLTDFESHAGDHATATIHGQLALTIAREQVTPGWIATQSQRTAIWEALLGLADVESNSHHHREAISHAQEALTLAQEINNDTFIINSLRDLSDIHYGAGNLDMAYELKRQCYQRVRQFGANLRDGEQDLREMCGILIKQNRPKDAIKLGTELWAELKARPDSKQDVTHLGHVAKSLLDCYMTLKTAYPETSVPHELAEWKTSVEASKGSKPTSQKLTTKSL